MNKPGKMLEIAGLAAQIILENGAETYRVEDTVVRLCRSFGFTDADVIALSTGVIISVGVPEHQEAIIRRVRKRRMNLSRVDAVNVLSRRVAGGGVSMEEALCGLREIDKSTGLRPIWPIMAAGLSAGCFALMFGGGLLEFGVALACGMLAQWVAHVFRQADISLVLVSLIGGLISSFFTMGAFHLFHLTHAGVETALAGAIMPLISGLMMTNAVRDSLRGDLLSGLARGAEALLVAVMVALGISLGLRFYLPGVGADAIALPPPWYLGTLYAGLATMFFCPLLGVPRKSALPALLLGMTAYGGCLLVEHMLDGGGTFALFCASAAVAVLCDLLARRMRMIATIFLCVALIPLVPGLGLYRTMRELLLGRFEGALSMGLGTVFAVGAIALGAAIGSLRLYQREGMKKG